MLTIGLLAIASLFIFNNPVKQRFSDLLNFNRESLYKEKFNAGDYFNGIEFRILLWPVTFDLLRDNHSFILGVGPSNTQSLIAKKFLGMGMYAGNETRNDRGYLDYNCHNQFLQISLQSGIIGLLIFIFWSITLIRMTWQRNDVILSGIVMMIFIFFFTEAVFEREFGMILCTVFPLLYLYPRNK
jgi:O-antigen ligase